ncbi:MAG: serine/threonine protein kinase, partial [Actinomycetota bacterium]|nr:serine/threonine protein kinase [Actinomycetota bacterium]
MGESFGKVPGYLLEAPIGEDSSSQLWRGRRSGSTEQVALKRLELHDVGEFFRARSAATLLAELEHPNLVRVRELVPSGTAVVLVTDLAAGGSLAEVLKDRGALPASEMIAALAPIADVLAYLHDAGVVHGDICPANVMFSDAGAPMLANLGVARLRGDNGPVHSTPDYIDPGVAAGFLPGPQSDVFMLAGVAIHALTGAALWPGEGVEHVLLNALIADLDNLGRRLDLAGVAPALQKVLRRALSVEPGGRGNAAELALGLRECAPGAIGALAVRHRPEAANAGVSAATAELAGPAAELAGP